MEIDKLNGSGANFQAIFSNMEWFSPHVYVYSFRNIVEW